MRSTVTALLLVWLALSGVEGKKKKTPRTTPIKHVVLLMEENRSFDHMCGWFPGVDGLTGAEWNAMDTTDPQSKKVYVTKDSPYVAPYSPDHSLDATTEKIFGNAGLKAHQYVPRMDGFVEQEIPKHGVNATSVMRMFTPERLPIMSTLAKEFALFDRMFASIPGPTWPNRLFQLMGTSMGDTATKQWRKKFPKLYTAKTVFHLFEEAGYDWAFYYSDAPLEAAMIEKLAMSPLKLHGWERFHEDVRKGNLPTFSWVNPRWFVNRTTGEGSNDQHPVHDVRLGEALLKEVYEALRAGPKWNETLFIVTYDEHGGYYDHVPPPMNVPAPDDSKSFPGDFNFTRLGVRVPALLISPYVKKGTVINKPRQNGTEFDLTSVIGTMKKMFSLKHHLTRRDAWAGTFEEYISEPEPRTDCPMHLPPAPKSLGAEHAAKEAASPLTDLQEEIVQQFHNLRGPSPLGNPPSTQGEAGEWIQKITQEILAGHHQHFPEEE